MDDFTYCSSDKVKQLEAELKADLAELKTELEDKDILRSNAKLARLVFVYR